MFGDARAYEQFMGRWSRLLAPLLLQFAGVRDGTAVLDIGSGTGALAFTVAERRAHCRVTGIDPSKEYVGYATVRNPFRDRVSFAVGDARQLRFQNAQFDAALSLLVFNFIPERDQALQEVSRVTKPGGPVCAAVWDYGAGMKMLRTFWDAALSVDPAAAPLDEGHMPLCREGELGQLWKENGLRNVEKRSLDIVMRFASFADYWEPFLLGQGPAGAYVRRQDEDRRQALRTEVKRRLNVTADAAPFSLPSRAWAVRGVVPERAPAA